MSDGLFGKRGIICLFGDSITELASDERGWGAQLGHHYMRRADVINRGYGRYNTRWARHLLPSIFPTERLCKSEVGRPTSKYFLVTVWFGANDASVGQNCSVPIEEFYLNLEAIVGHLKNFFEHIVVISPTPVDGDRRLRYQRERYGAGATGVLERSTERAGRYRGAAEAVAQSSPGVLFLDLFKLMVDAGENVWPTFLASDGLHLSPDGQAFVGKQLLALLDVSGLARDSLPQDFFPWDQSTPGDEHMCARVMDGFEETAKSCRLGLGLHMPNFPSTRLDEVDCGRETDVTMKSMVDDDVLRDDDDMFEECGVTLTALSTLNRFFRHKPQVQILGFGSLMSEQSARVTFPHLTDFRIVRVEGYRRVFRHPAAVFFERGIANLDTLQISSLCAEKHEGGSFVASVFTIAGETGDNFLQREEEFDFHVVRFESLLGGHCGDSGDSAGTGTGAGAGAGTGLMCVAGSDAHYVARWGQRALDEKYLSRGLGGIWSWTPHSGILPCSVYLRHCYLSAKKLTHTPEIFESFMNDTYLCDRVTTIAQYLATHPEVLSTLPPESVASRYCG